MTRAHRLGIWLGLTLAAVPLNARADFHDTLLYNWSGYIDPAVDLKYLEATGRTLVIDTYDLADEAEGRLSAGGTGYDVAVVPSEAINRLITHGALSPLPSRIAAPYSDRESMMRSALREAVPEVDRYATPYLWGTTGVVYHRENVLSRIPDAPLDSWALIFDPENAAALADCGLTIVDSVEEVVPAALAYLGRDPNSKDQADIDAAFAAIGAIAPYVSSFDTDQFDDVSNGEICAAITWSSDGLGNDPDGQPTGAYEYVTPLEGANFWVDLLVIPDDARDLARSAELIDLILSPEVLIPSADYAGACSSIGYSPAGAEPPAPGTSCAELAAPNQSHLYFLQSRSDAEKAYFDAQWRLVQIEGL